VHPWYENGYLVHVETYEVPGSAKFEALYWLTAPDDESEKDRVIVRRTRVPGVFLNEFTAWSTAAGLGQQRALSLPKAD
jgi:hypothetical protein